MKFRDFIRILVRHGFEKLDRQRGSDRLYQGRIGGNKRLMVVACHSENDEIKPGTLASMIRGRACQSVHSADESLTQGEAL